MFMKGSKNLIISSFQAYNANLKPIRQIKNIKYNKTGSVTRAEETLRCYVTSYGVGRSRVDA